MKLDFATPEDLVKLTTIGVTMFMESPHYSRFTYDPGKVFDILSLCVGTEKGVAVVLRDDNGEVVGGLIGVVEEHWFGHSKMAYDIAFFILPEYRHGRWGIKLIQAFVESAKEKGADEVQLTNTSGVMSERVEKLIEYCDFTRVGGMFYKVTGE